MLSICAFANPVLDTAETAFEITVAEDAVLAADLVKGVKPGLNMVGQTAGVWSFEETDGMNNVSMFSGVSKVVANPLSDSVNSSATVAYSGHTGSGYPALTFNLSEEVDGARPVYVTFKYYKDYTSVADEVGTTGSELWVMRNGATYIAKNIGGFGFNGAWKQYSGLVIFDDSTKAGTSEKMPEPVKQILIETKVAANAGTTNVYFDDVAFIPSYKVTYMANDGTEEAEPVAVKYALLNAAGKMLTKYYIDKTVAAPEKEGYDFLGWATTADATAPVATVTLANEDIVLYPVYKAQPLKAGWDFETAESQTWGTAYARTYRNGMMVLDSATQASGYTGHTNVSFDTSVYKYLVIKARSVDSVDSIKLYFMTTKGGASEAQTVTVKINPYSDEFTEYVVDMSSNAGWIGNYTSCMFQLNGTGKGIVEFEEIYFTSDVEKRAAWVFEGSKQDGINPWGHSKESYVENGNLVIVKDSVTYGGSGAVDLKPIAYSTNALSYSVDATENPYLIIKSPRGKGPESFQVYYITGAMSSITGSSYVHAYKYGSDATHDYYLADFSVKSDYANGFIKAFWLGASANGTFYVDEVYVTNRKPSLEKVTGWDFESGSASGVRSWGSYTSSITDGKMSAEQTSTAHGGLYVTPSNIIAEENQYFVVKQVNAESVGKPGGLYPVGAYKAGIDGNLYMNYTTSYTTGDGVYTYYVYDLTKADKNANDGIGYTGNVGQCCLTTSGKCVWEDMYFTDDLSNIIAEGTIAKDNFTAPAASITTEGGSVKLTPFTSYANGWVLDYTYELSNDNATIVKKTDGTAVLTAKYNGEVTVTMTANNKPATVYTHTVAISGQAPVYTINYNANTTDTVTGMPEASKLQTWDSSPVIALSDAVPVREGYTFVGWTPDADNYVSEHYVFKRSQTSTTVYAVWTDTEVGLFPVAAKDAGLSGKSLYVNGIWTNSSSIYDAGGSVIVPLTDGVGYVLVGISSDLENAVAYKVTADACEKLDYVPAKTLAQYEARATGDTGIRFKASVAHKMRNEGNVAEYGFVVSTANQISDGDNLDLDLVGYSEAVKGVAYSKVDNIDKYTDETEEGVIMQAVITGVKADKKSYETTIYVRPYMVLNSGLEVYGLTTSTTYLAVAQAIAENMPEDAPYANYINSIIDTCKE